MQCDYFDAHRCRSCSWIEREYGDQLAAKQRAAADRLPATTPWLAPVASAESGFRNKAKMTVAGTVEQPTLGILDEEYRGIDLRGCRLHEPGLIAAMPVLAEFITRADLTPYDVSLRRGELKHLLVTVSPDGELMVRFVTRSQEPVARLRKHLPWLLERLPVVVASVNLQPDHKAILEGDREIVLTDHDELAMRTGSVTLRLRPQSFFQTNTAIATALYETARMWIEPLQIHELWDLYCGVGGFALHLARPGTRVRGIELSAEAVVSAQRTADAAGIDAEFVAGDATKAAGAAPDLVVVNPPRRGLGDELTGWLESAAPDAVLYSSCNPLTLARDLDQLPRYEITRAQVFDMFPHTAHAEVLVLMRRRS